MSIQNYYIYHLETNNNPIELKNRLLDNPHILLFFDARNIVCEEQILNAIAKAERALKTNTNLAKKFEIEVMVHLAGRHQIQAALELFDVNEFTAKIILVQKIDKTLIELSLKGMPDINNTERTYTDLELMSDDPCKEIISKSTRMSLDYE